MDYNKTNKSQSIPLQYDGKVQTPEVKAMADAIIHSAMIVCIEGIGKKAARDPMDRGENDGLDR